MSQMSSLAPFEQDKFMKNGKTVPREEVEPKPIKEEVVRPYNKGLTFE